MFNRETRFWEFSLLYRPRHAFSRKILRFRKFKSLNFDRFFRNFEFSQKLLCQMLDETFNRKKRLPEFFLQKRRLLVFCKRNVVFGKIPESQIRLSYLSLFVPFAFRKKISKSISSFSWAIGVLHRVIRKFWFTYFFSQYFLFFFLHFYDCVVSHDCVVIVHATRRPCHYNMCH